MEQSCEFYQRKRAFLRSRTKFIVFFSFFSFYFDKNIIPVRMITTKADKLIRSLIDAGLSLTEFTLLATRAMRIQRDFTADDAGRRRRDRARQQEHIREQHHFQEQLKKEEERKMKGMEKLRDLGYVTGDERHPLVNDSSARVGNDRDDEHVLNSTRKTDMRTVYSKEMNDLKQKQRDCCLTFNIDYDLRLNQQALERACRTAKRNVYEVCE